MAKSRPRIAPSIKKHFYPLLREDGFEGKGVTYRKVVNEFIHLLNFQGNQRQYGDFCVNLSVQPIVLYRLRDEVPEFETIQEYQCELRNRLSTGAGDQWWSYEAERSSIDAAMIAAAQVYVNFGRALFAHFTDETSPLHTITPQEFAADQYSLFGFGTSKLNNVLLLGRFRKALGRDDDARAVAAIGRTLVGQVPYYLREFASLEGTA